MRFARELIEKLREEKDEAKRNHLLDVLETQLDREEEEKLNLRFRLKEANDLLAPDIDVSEELRKKNEAAYAEIPDEFQTSTDLVECIGYMKDALQDALTRDDGRYEHLVERLVFLAKTEGPSEEWRYIITALEDDPGLRLSYGSGDFTTLLGEKTSMPPRCPVCARYHCQGNYSIHRDGFGVGPEVSICDACGSRPEPTAEEIWERLRDMMLPGGSFESIAIFGDDHLSFSLHRHPEPDDLKRIHEIECEEEQAEVAVLAVFDAETWGVAKLKHEDLMASFIDKNGFPW